jgi:hypothetical protein
MTAQDREQERRERLFAASRMERPIVGVLIAAAVVILIAAAACLFGG